MSGNKSKDGFRKKMSINQKNLSNNQKKMSIDHRIHDFFYFWYIKGDGGGPLACEEDDGYYTLTGLVSWGFGCGRKDVPGVYVKISSFIGWINQIISVNNL